MFEWRFICDEMINNLDHIYLYLKYLLVIRSQETGGIWLILVYLFQPL